MGIINRTQDSSEQQEIFVIAASGGVTATTSDLINGSTFYCPVVVPRACVIQSIQATAFGVSGTPQLFLGCLRFANTTSFAIGTTMAIPTFGTSGYLPYSLGAAGNTQLNLQKGDVLNARILGGSGAAVTSFIVNIVVKNTQDIRSWF